MLTLSGAKRRVPWAQWVATALFMQCGETKLAPCGFGQPPSAALGEQGSLGVVLSKAPRTISRAQAQPARKWIWLYKEFLSQRRDLEGTRESLQEAQDKLLLLRFIPLYFVLYTTMFIWGRSLWERAEPTPAIVKLCLIQNPLMAVVFLVWWPPFGSG